MLPLTLNCALATEAAAQKGKRMDTVLVFMTVFLIWYITSFERKAPLACNKIK